MEAMYIQSGSMVYLPLNKLHSLLSPPPSLQCSHAHMHTHIQKDLLKTKETLYRLAASVRQLPDRYVLLLEILTVTQAIISNYE